MTPTGPDRCAIGALKLPNPREAVDHELDRFKGWLDRLAAAKEWSTRVPLYHYTSADSAKKILQSKKLHLRQTQSQLDDYEIAFGLNIFKKLIEHNLRFANSKIHNRIFNSLNVITIEMFYSKYCCYISCFAPHSEDFDLWERYGQRGAGIAIGFRPEFFNIPFESGANPFVQPVHYGEQAVAHQYRKIIQILSMSIGELSKVIKNNSDYDHAVYQLVNRVITQHVLPLAMLAKAETFRPESEIRMLLPIERTESVGAPEFQSLSFDIGMVESIVVGERCDQALAEALSAETGVALKTAAYSRGLDVIA